MQTTKNTRALLAAHIAQYPMAEVQDLMKYMYQSSFGCEHLVADALAAAAYIRREAAQAEPHEGAIIEPLDGGYCRVHLDVLRDGLTPETLAALFARSAEHHADGAQALEEKISVFLDMVRDGRLPFDLAQAEQAVGAWRAAGFPACHHSERFRQAYAPAYRLLKTDYVKYLPLFSAIDRRLSEDGRLIVSVDGCCASGKSTLAALLEDVYGCPVLHMDDFFLRPEQRTQARYAEPGGNVDRERFQEEVLSPLCAGETVRYRPFDCGTMTLQAPVTVAPAPLTVIEGSYSLHPALKDAYGLTVFMTISPEKQMERIILRNGEGAAEMFRTRWIPLEQAYHTAYRPDQTSDLVIHAD